MDRRIFLFRSASLMAGSLFGFNSFSKAFAFGEHKTKPVIKPRIALIIDDIGSSLSRTRQFLNLEVPITFSILPRLAHSRDLAVEIHDKGHEIMLHQPMEPFNSHLDPGPGALYMGHTAKEVERIMEENIAEVPFAVGVNNHMGSKFTESKKEVNEVLDVINRKGLFFVDSVTSNRSTAYETARRLHMATAFRNIFLDNLPEESGILSQLHELKKHARENGRAIGIGHPYPQTASAIGRFLSDLKESGVPLVHVSQVLNLYS